MAIGNGKNYAFIDSQNVNLGIQDLGWKLDQNKFRRYLREKYNVGTAYLFIGFSAEYQSLYNSLQKSGYVLIFKPTIKDRDGKMKGNIDAELVLQAMIDLDSYEKAIIVTSDGDFSCLVKYLSEKNKLDCVLSPNQDKCSKLLQKVSKGNIAFMDNLKIKLEHKEKTP